MAKKEGFKAAFAGRGGLRAELLSTGIIRVGDPIIVGDPGLYRLEQAKKVLQETDAALQGDILDDLRECLRKLQELNSSFPAVQEFLKARGLQSVDELNKDGIRDLKDHLLAILHPPQS